MRILLHSCCGPCTVGSLPQLTDQGFEPFCLFYNPNIHPYQEYLARKKAFCQLMEKKNIAFKAIEDYALENWLSQVADNLNERCTYCYKSRLSVAAAFAKEHGFEAFSSTLLISPYQDQQSIIDIGKQVAKDFEINFINIDLRPGFRKGQQQAREMGLYMQKYCGCIYSEKERYLGKSKGVENA